MKNYYTYRINIVNSDRVQVQKWNAQHESMGEPSGKLRYQEKQEEIKKLLQIVSNNELNNLNQTRILGEALFDVLFDNTLRQDFVSFHFQAVQQEKQFLRVELDIDEQRMPELAALPWEFMYLPASANSGEIWLSTDPNLVFSRRRAQWNPAPPIQLEPGEKLRIALAIAAPQDLGEVEYKTVQTALEELVKEQSDRIELLPIVNPATLRDIDGLLEKQPHIFHFIGHGRFQDDDGNEVGQIALVKKVFNTERPNWVDASVFGGLFTRPRLGIVFLQACEGGMLSESEAFVGVTSKIVQQNIPVVVAMQYKVSNFTASQFAYKFYERLAQDYPVDIAAQHGRRTIALETQYRKRDFATPVIFMRVQDGYLFKRNIAENSTIIQLLAKDSHFGNVSIDSGWPIVKQVLGMQKTELLFAIKNKSNQELIKSEEINLGEQDNISLLIDVIYISSYEKSIVLEVHPGEDKMYLPLGFQFNILDSSGQFLQRSIANRQDKWMKQEITGKLGEKFSINFQLGDYIVVKNFVI